MKKTFAAIITVSLFWLIFWGDFDPFRYSRNLHCNTMYEDSRSLQICESIQNNQEYEFTGHAIPSAGYKTTFSGVKKTWCELNLSVADKSTLENMSDYPSNYDKNMSDGYNRMQIGIDFLLRIIDGIENSNAPEDIFNPKYGDSYILNGGCK